MSDLNSLRKKKPVPLAITTVTTPAQPSSGTVQFIIGLVVGCVIGALIFSYFAGSRSDDGDHKRHDHQEQVEPVKGGMLLFVSDKQLPTIDEEMLMRKMPEFCASNGVGFLWLDDTDGEGKKAIAVGQSKGIQWPLVAYVVDRKVVRIAKWPADEAAVKSFLK